MPHDHPPRVVKRYVSHFRLVSISALVLSALSTAAASPLAPTAAQRLVQPARREIVLSGRPVDPTCVFIDTWQQARGNGRLHEGVDIVTTAGKPIYAVVDGTISKMYLDEPASRSGNGLRLALADGTYFFYAHMQQFAAGVQVGLAVKAGDVIGYIGHTGNTLLDHLHFEVHPNGGAAVDPTPIVRAADTCKIPASPTGVTSPPLSSAAPPAPPPTLYPTATRTTAAPPVTTLPTPAPASATTAAAAPATTAATAAAAPAPPPQPPSAPAPQPVVPVAAPSRTTAAGKGLTVVGPLRVADSRFGTAKKLLANATTKISIARLGVPASIASAQITVWSVGSGSDGYLTVFPCDGTVPSTSTLSFTAGQTVSASTFVGVNNGKVCVVSSTATDVIVDVSAYSDGKAPTGVIATAPFRAFDSTWAGSRILKGKERAVRVAGAAGMPASAAAVTLTLTTSHSTSRTSLQAYACGATPSGVPVVVGGIGETNSAGATVKVSGVGSVCFVSNADLDLIVDVHIAWAKGGAQLQSIPPVRLLDTRSGNPQSAGATREIAVGGNAGIPGGATAAAISVTVAGASSATQVAVWPCGKKKPNTVVLAVAAGQTASGGATVSLGAGKLCISTTGTAHLVVDVTGYAK